eukprot:scaffold134784_cov32-Tisochrysis_lutea.AAC.4
MIARMSTGLLAPVGSSCRLTTSSNERRRSMSFARGGIPKTSGCGTTSPRQTWLYLHRSFEMGRPPEHPYSWATAASLALKSERASHTTAPRSNVLRNGAGLAPVMLVSACRLQHLTEGVRGVGLVAPPTKPRKMIIRCGDLLERDPRLSGGGNIAPQCLLKICARLGHRLLGRLLLGHLRRSRRRSRCAVRVEPARQAEIGRADCGGIGGVWRQPEHCT